MDNNQDIINIETLSYYDSKIKDFIKNRDYELISFNFEDLNAENLYFKEKIDNGIYYGYTPANTTFYSPSGKSSAEVNVIIYWFYNTDEGEISFILSGRIAISKDEDTNEEYIFGSTPFAMDHESDEIIPEGEGFLVNSFIYFVVNSNKEVIDSYEDKKFIYLLDGGTYTYLKDFKNFFNEQLNIYFNQIGLLIIPRDGEATDNNIPIFYTTENPEETLKGHIKDSGKRFNETKFTKFTYVCGGYYDDTLEDGRANVYTKETFDTVKTGSSIYNDINCTNKIGYITQILPSGDYKFNINGEIFDGYLTNTYEIYSNDLIPTENSVYNYINEQAYTNNEDVNNIIENKLGGNELSTKIYSLRNTTDDTQLVYSLNDLTLAPVGTIVYQDKDCTIEYGKVTYNMSGTLKIDIDQSINWALNGSEDYVSDKRIATESGVKNYVDEQHSEKEWTTYSNANNYITSGVYQFAGWRKNLNDNLPITNYDEDDVDRNNIAFTLVVNAKDGYLVRNDEGNVTRNIPTMIAQTLMIGNRRGSDTKIYTRHGQTDLATHTTTWEAWREVMTSTYLGILDSYTGDVLNGATEIGLYTGAMVHMASNTADVFKLEVINNYSVTTQVSAAMGTSIPNSVLQTITILNLNGSNATKKRTGTYNGSGYTWSEWKEEVGGVSTTKHKRGDVVILQQLSGSINTKVISWEEFKETYQNYHCSGDIYAQEEFPIGLVADPDKRTFLYLKELSGDVYTSIKNNIESLGNTFYSNGIENTHLIEIQIGTNITNIAGSDGIFYSGSNTQLKQFIPSYEESVMGKIIDSGNTKNDIFYARLIELNNLMNDSTHYPMPYGPDNSYNNIFYCLNSTFRKDGASFYTYHGYGSPYVITFLNEGYMEFFGIYFND